MKGYISSFRSFCLQALLDPIAPPPTPWRPPLLPPSQSAIACAARTGQDHALYNGRPSVSPCALRFLLCLLWPLQLVALLLQSSLRQKSRSHHHRLRLRRRLRFLPFCPRIRHLLRFCPHRFLRRLIRRRYLHHHRHQHRHCLQLLQHRQVLFHRHTSGVCRRSSRRHAPQYKQNCGSKARNAAFYLC